MRPTFIISFDCEGKWGHADRLSPKIRRILRTGPLSTIFHKSVRLLDSFELPGTFSFVGAFTLHADQYLSYIHPIRATPCGDDFFADVARSELDGWFCPEMLAEVHVHGRHELASHSFTHLQFDEVPAQAAELELAACVALAHSQGWRPRSFVFPKNRVGHLELLARHGFTSYRGRRHFTFGRPGSLASEFNLWESADPHPTTAGSPLDIPCGHFLNWPHGLRLAVPPDVTVKRWCHILDDAIRHNRVAHCWLQPHNLLNGRGQFELMERVLREVRIRVDAGLIEPMTQEAYARQALADLTS